MTPEHIALVHEHLASIEPQLAEVAGAFYARLFAADPALRQMFGTDPGEQRAKFAAELRAIVELVHQHEAFMQRTAELGARHVGYGVRARHYAQVGDALLGALEAAAGPAWTAALGEAWQSAYALTAEAMMAGAATVPYPALESRDVS
jgi:hemoglobin-like flavoprotein